MDLHSLELENEADLELIVSFAKRLNASILDITQTNTIENNNTDS